MRPWILAALAACGGAPAPSTPSNTVERGQDDLCRVLDQVVAATSSNFMTIESSHARDTGAFATALRPADADSAMMYPCCASDSAESGPWTWGATWTRGDSGALFADLTLRIKACPFGAALQCTEYPKEHAIECVHRAAGAMISLAAHKDAIDLKVAAYER